MVTIVVSSITIKKPAQMAMSAIVCLWDIDLIVEGAPGPSIWSVGESNCFSDIENAPFYAQFLLHNTTGMRHVRYELLYIGNISYGTEVFLWYNDPDRRLVDLEREYAR